MVCDISETVRVGSDRIHRFTDWCPKIPTGHANVPTYMFSMRTVLAYYSVAYYRLITVMILETVTCMLEQGKIIIRMIRITNISQPNSI